jgi:hypothetical protein
VLGSALRAGARPLALPELEKRRAVDLASKAAQVR